MQASSINIKQLVTIADELIAVCEVGSDHFESVFVQHEKIVGVIVAAELEQSVTAAVHRAHEVTKLLAIITTHTHAGLNGH